MKILLIPFFTFSVFAFNSSHKSVSANFETEPVISTGDAADDTAMWFHPSDSQKSLIVATDKKAGLLLYSLEGRQVHSSPAGLINNIDAQEGVLYDQKSVTLFAGSDRSLNAISLFTILNADNPQISSLGSVYLDYIPYGICVSKKTKTKTSVFVTTKEGLIDHWTVEFAGRKLISQHVGSWKVSGKSEGCVADEKTAQLFVSEEAVGLWRFDLRNPGQPPLLVDKVGERLVADVEGVTIYRNPAGKSYILVSSQGDNSFHVYDLENLRHQGSFVIESHVGIDGVSDTDGIEVVGAQRLDLFPEGLFIAQDGENHDGTKVINQNFKVVLWKDIKKALNL